MSRSIEFKICFTYVTKMNKNSKKYNIDTNKKTYGAKVYCNLISIQ